MAQLLKRWEERTFDLLGQQIRLRLKAPSFDEAPAFIRSMMAFGRAGLKAQQSAGEGLDAQAQGADTMFAALDPKWVRDVFAKCVKPAEPVLVEDDDKTLTTGEEVYEIANAALVLDVLTAVQELVMLGAAEGKASSSRSTSGAGTTDAGGSPATTTGPADGTTP